MNGRTPIGARYKAPAIHQRALPTAPLVPTAICIACKTAVFPPADLE